MGRAGVLLLVVLLTACGASPPPRADTGCWKRLAQDAYDGAIDASFPAACYRTAIAHLPVDAYLPIRGMFETGLRQAAGGLVPPERSWPSVRRSIRAGRTGGARALATWEHSLAGDRLSAVPTRFRAPSRRWLLARLARLQAVYHFRVTGLRYLHAFPGGPRPAPLLIVRADPGSFVRATRLVLAGLDEKPRSNAREPVVWNYEAFFLEARDQFDAPFLAVFDNWRASDPGGGQWARSEALYPFPHG